MGNEPTDHLHHEALALPGSITKYVLNSLAQMYMYLRSWPPRKPRARKVLPDETLGPFQAR